MGRCDPVTSRDDFCKHKFELNLVARRDAVSESFSPLVMDENVF